MQTRHTHEQPRDITGRCVHLVPTRQTKTRTGRKRNVASPRRDHGLPSSGHGEAHTIPAHDGALPEMGREEGEMPKETTFGTAYVGSSSAMVAWSKTGEIDGGPFSGGPITLRVRRFGDDFDHDLVIDLTREGAAALAMSLRKAARTAVDSID